MKQVIKLNESDIRKIVNKAVRRVLYEDVNKSREYINIDVCSEFLTKVFSKLLETLDIIENVKNHIKDNCLDDYVFYLASSLNNSMRKYLHLKDHSILGNFSNIDYDWKGETNLKDIIDMLDQGVNNEITQEFKNFATEWIFEAFGTYQIKDDFIDFVVKEEKEYNNDKDSD